jgi:hypothetical protein
LDLGRRPLWQGHKLRGLACHDEVRAAPAHRC